MNTHKDEPRPDWMEWNQRCQQWMIQVWDVVGIGKTPGRGMFVMLTDEQADVIFEGLKLRAWNSSHVEPSLTPLETAVKAWPPKGVLPKASATEAIIMEEGDPPVGAALAGIVGQFGCHIDRLEMVQRRFAEQVGKMDDTVAKAEMWRRARER